MAQKISQQDFSGWTFQPTDDQGNPVQPAQAAPTPGQAVAATVQRDLTPAPRAQPAGPPPTPLPDITSQEPHSFAALSANLARSQMANPTVDDYNKVYEEALGKAQDLQKTRATELERQTLEQTKQFNLQKSQAALEVAKATQLEPLEVQKAADIKKATAPIEEVQKLRDAQLAEGLTPDQAQAQWESAGNKGPAALIKALPTTELDKATGFVNGYKNVTDLHSAFNGMIQNAPGTGGVLKSGVLGLVTQPGMTSPQTRVFNSVLDSSLVPLARGVFGDTGATAGKELIQAQLKDALPNASDNEMSGGQKVYMLKKRIFDNLQTQRDLLAGRYDTSVLDAQIAGMNKDLKGLDQYNPLKAPGAVVQTSLSPQANLNLNAKIAPTPQPAQPQPAASPQLPPTPQQIGQSQSAQTSLLPAMAN